MTRPRALLLAALLSVVPTSASAFCGFYVGGATTDLYNDATQVVLMRSGRHTVMSLQNNYQGPPERFAMVVPVPVVLQQDDVRTLSRDLFNRVDQLAAPRLVEYWEQDPCPRPVRGDRLGGLRTRSGGGRGGGMQMEGAELSRNLGVRVEAEFAVGEYDIVILSAEDSSGLETWLHREGYQIPNGAAVALRPYVEAGTNFFVARVDPARLTFTNGRAKLSPLRVHFESDQLELPIRLGMLNARGAQDLIVHVIGNSRYEVANRPNVTIPTNLRVRNNVSARFGSFYSALFDATVAANPGAVVTEYAWSPSTCDPCPGPTLTGSDMATLGGDVIWNLPSSSSSSGPTIASGRLVSLRGPLVVEAASMRAPIQRLLRARVRTFDRCVQRSIAPPASRGLGALRATPSSPAPPTAGRFEGVLEFDVVASGTTTNVRLSGGVPPAVSSCFTSMVHRMRFNHAEPTHVRVGVGASWSPGAGARAMGMTLTRLHYRYTAADSPDDLVFREAGALVGGRGVPDERGRMERSVTTSGTASFFQGRYAILHPWRRAMTCAHPQRGVWGGPPNGGQHRVSAARNLGDVRSRTFGLRRAVIGGIPGLPAQPRRRGRRKHKRLD